MPPSNGYRLPTKSRQADYGPHKALHLEIFTPLHLLHFSNFLNTSQLSQINALNNKKGRENIMAPIRVGFLGLSKGGWARSAHFPYLNESDKYQIVAICNSSVSSAQDAIKLYNLPASTKAYSNPEGPSSPSSCD
jgi:hypothetical protein